MLEWQGPKTIVQTFNVTRKLIDAIMTTEVLNIMPPADSSPRGVKRTAENENSAVTSDLDYETPPKRRMSGNFADTNDNENGESSEKSANQQQQQKRRRRRRRQKRSGQHKGYYEMTEVERRKYEERTRNRLERTKEKMLAKGHMLAPYNSTQFLINDANDDTVRLLDEALHDNGGGASPGGASSSCGERNSRSRQSSFSVEDEEDYFYSSPDDEGEFLTKEFSKDYEQSSVDRLEGMPKDRLILEYLGMEKQVEALEKRLEEIQDREAVKALTGEVDYEFSRGEIPMEPETAQKIKVFQAEIRRLAKENKALHMENARLKRKQRSVRTSTTAAGGSGSFWTANGSTSSSDSEDEQQLINGGDTNDQQDLFPAIKAAVAVGSCHSKGRETDGGKTEDTGYESTQSKEQTPERDFVRR